MSVNFPTFIYTKHVSVADLTVIFIEISVGCPTLVSLFTLKLTKKTYLEFSKAVVVRKLEGFGSNDSFEP